MTTDRQAALAAASQVMAATRRGCNIASELDTLNMADGFLRWLEGRSNAVPASDGERLTPNVDFHSPSSARTERVDPSAVLAAAADRTMPVRTVQRYVGPHAMSGVHTTPSGAYACLCGEKWPCSQRSDPGDHI